MTAETTKFTPALALGFAAMAAVAWGAFTTMRGAPAEPLPALAALEPGWTTIAPGGETACAHGTPYEFHVKPGRADRLFVFLNGGGACWTGALCSLDEEPTPYVPVSRIEHNDPRRLKGVFDAGNADNPLADWTQVFVSYCTGDVHLGNRDVTYDDGKEEITVRHRGRRNVRAALDWVYANVKAPERVLVAGSSAGGIAAPWYAVEVAAEYPKAGIAVLGDGAGGYRDPAVAPLMEGWGFWDDAPSWTNGIEGDGARFEDIWRKAAEAEPRLTLAQFDNAYDEVQEMFLKLLGTEARLHPLVAANRADLAAAIPGFRSYTAGGTPHTLIRFDRLYTYEVDGVRAVDWLRDMAEGRAVANVTCGAAAACEREPGAE
ncbi:MAG: pectin acetylesterase-family hydrolase [Parvibaculum sp.]|uniref:pectin acetylesterase-family hydrolase n=1 Tax=Parvibaculum sp. TaxID=2024848 RepID=UPI00349FF668